MVEKPRVTKNVNNKKSLRVNRNSFDVSPSVETCLTHSSMDAARRNPHMLVSKTRSEFECGKISSISTPAIHTKINIRLWSKSTFRKNHQINGDPLFVAHQAIDQIDPNIIKKEMIVRRFDSTT